MIPRRALVALAVSVALGAVACGRYTTSYAAVVNGSRITMAELGRAVAASGAGRQQQQPQQQPAEQQRQVLLQLIQRRLITQQVRRLEVVLSQRDVDARVARVRALFGSDAEFRQAITAQGLNEAAFRDRMRDQTSIEKLQEKVVPITIADAEIRAEYRAQLPDLTRVHARHILFSNATRSAAEALALARDAVAKLRAGADFAALAGKVSDDPGSKSRGGDLGTQSASQFVPEFARAITRIAVKAISDPVKTSFGYHVVQVLDRTTLPFAKARDQIRAEIFASKARMPFQRFLGDVLARSRIEVNPRIGDIDTTTLQIVDHRFFVPSTPEPGEDGASLLRRPAAIPGG